MTKIKSMQILCFCFFLLSSLCLFFSFQIMFQNHQLKSELEAKEYQQLTPIISTNPTPTSTDTNQQSYNNLIKRCGEIPSQIDTPVSAQVSGPFWSPDCRFITWSIVKGLATGWADPDNPEVYQPLPSPTPNPDDGIYLYNDRTKKITTIYKPKTHKQDLGVVGWESPSQIIYLVDNSKSVFDTQTNNF